MFWGVTLETGKRYSQTVDQSYHLTQAALEPPSGDGKKPSKYVSVMVEHEKSEFMICTLEPDRNLQVPLDHMFVEGEEVTYYLTGEGTVHLTGYLVYGDDYDDFDEELDEEEDEESEEEEDDSVKVTSIKRKNEALESSPEIGKKAKVDPKLQTQNKALKADVKQVAKKNEQKDNALNKSKNQNQVLKTNAINNRKQSEDSDEEDSDGDEEESDEDMDDSLGLIDKEAVEADDSDDEEEDEEDSSDDESDESPQKNSIPNKGKQNKQNQPKQQQNKQQNQQQNKNKQNQPNQQNKSPQNNQQNKSPQNQKPFGSGQKGGFQGNQKGGQFQKGNWNQSGQKKPFGGNQNSGQKPFGGNQNSGQKPNQWQNKKQFGGQNQGKDQQFGGQNNSPNFKGKPQTPNFKGPQRGNFNQTPNSNQKDNANEKKTNQRKLKEGIIVEDIREGSGPDAKRGKFVHVSYVGRFTNNEVFDRSEKKPFSFKLGEGEVIKGWDLGLEGMKVGGKRKITVPPNMGYGNRPVGKIPANSTLQFDIELKSVT